MRYWLTSITCLVIIGLLCTWLINVKRTMITTCRHMFMRNNHVFDSYENTMKSIKPFLENTATFFFCYVSYNKMRLSLLSTSSLNADGIRIVWIAFGSFLQHSRLLPCKPIHRLISFYTQFDVSHGNEVLCGLIAEVKLSISVNDLSPLAQGFWVSFCQTYGFILSLLYTKIM